MQFENHGIRIGKYFINLTTPKQFTKEQWLETIDKRIMFEQIHNYEPQLRSIIYDKITNMDYDCDHYKSMKSFASPLDQLIVRDIDRTLQSLEYFQSKPRRQETNKSVLDDRFLEENYTRNQRRLFNILRAYANHDTQIGYVQGMNCIVGVLMYSLDNGDPLLEVRVFYVFLYIMYKMNWRQSYHKSMYKINGLINDLQKRIIEQVPAIQGIFPRLALPFSKCFHGPLFALLGQKTSVEFAIKVIDYFLFEGEQVIFTVILNCFRLNQEEILSITDNDILTVFIQGILSYSVDKFGISVVTAHTYLLLK